MKTTATLLPERKKKLKVRAAPQPQKKPKAILKHRLFVPTYLVKNSDKEAFTAQVPNYYDAYDEFGDERLDRTLYVEGWKEHKRLEMTSFTRGDVDKMNEVFGSRFDIEDKTADVMLKYDIKFLGVRVGEDMLPLRPEQKDAIKSMMKRHFGIIKAPPRFGKTTVMTRLVTKYKRRTIMFCHQSDLGKQFLNEFRACTNVTEIERKIGKPIIGIVKKWKDLEKYEVAICTWQLLHHHPEAVKKYANSFGMMLVDEGHRFSSKFSSKVVGRFNTRFRIAVTATPERKDQRDVIFKQIVGPVTVVGQTKQVPLRVNLVFTGFSPKFTRFLTYMKRCAESSARNKMCLDLVEKEVKEGKSVLIVTTLREHIEELVRKLKLRGIAAEAFYGGCKNRDDILRRAKAGNTKVIVGMRSMLTGVNVQRWSSIHILQATANAPNHYQEFSRVRTPLEGKLYATVFHYIDNCGAARGCYRTCHQNYISQEYQPISFVDKHGNILKKNPSLKQINEWSMCGHKYDDSSGDGDDAGNRGGKGRRPTGFTRSGPTWGKASYKAHAAKYAKK